MSALEFYKKEARKLLRDEEFMAFCEEHGLTEGEVKALALTLALAYEYGEGDALAAMVLRAVLNQSNIRPVLESMLRKILGNENDVKWALSRHSAFHACLPFRLKKIAIRVLR